VKILRARRIRLQKRFKELHALIEGLS